MNENYREEVLKPFFKNVKSGESFYLLGAPSVGKTRLMDFMMGDDPDIRRENPTLDRNWIREKYLGKETAAQTWFVRVDMNRMRQEYDWGFGFFELMLNATLLACNKVEQTESTENIRNRLANLDTQVMESKDALTAHRFFEIAVHSLCNVHGIRLCFLFDEFDITYQTMPFEAFNQLRAVRDANKHLLFYALFLRNLPEKLRDLKKTENFYELISRNPIGIGPYSAADTFQVIEQLEKRHNLSLSPAQRDWLRETSGGHPGLIQGLLSLLKDNTAAASRTQDLSWIAHQEVIREEFRKLWDGLLNDEQDGLTMIARGDQNAILPSTGKLLITKGLIRTSKDGVKPFTPLLEFWL